MQLKEFKNDMALPMSPTPSGNSFCCALIA
jgi:hypothetical protein